MEKKYLLGIFLAIGAAVSNGTVGVFSKGIFETNLTPAGVSFYKCLIAFLVISVFSGFSSRLRNHIKQLRSKWPKLALCSFLGIFVLYFFETTAYKFELVPIVVFVLLGSSAVATFVFSSFYLSERKSWRQYLGFMLLIIGVGIMFLYGGYDFTLSLGLLLAAIAGVGYGLFLVVTKKFEIIGDLSFIWYLVGFGSIFLFVPFSLEGPTIPSIGAIPMLLILAVLPTIGGFYCTTKALNYIDASKVQLFELTEPVFASVFAFVFLGEFIKGSDWVGAILILLAIYISEYQRKDDKKVKSNKSEVTSAN